MTRLLFRDATLLAGAEDWRPRRTDILLAEGRIASLDTGTQPADVEVIDASHLLLLPAFVNAHTHSPEALARGRAPMERLDGWLGAQYAAGEDTLPAAEIRRAILLCAAEAIRGGAVRVTDHFRQSPQTDETVAVAAAAWGESGMRARLAVMLRDLPSPSGTPTMDMAGCLALAEAVLRRPPAGAAIGLGPSAPQRCSDGLLRGMADLARTHGSFIHLHVCETALDRARCLERYRRPAVMQLEALGMAGRDVEYAHCVHLDDDELDRMAATGTTLVHNPLANLRLGSGIAPVARALARGVRVAIGTDGAGSNDTQDMLEAAKLALLLPRAGRPDAEWPTPEQILTAATGGHALVPGAIADLIAFDLRAPAFIRAQPEEIAARLLLAARPRDLLHVIAAGAFLLRDGAFTSPALRDVAP